MRLRPFVEEDVPLFQTWLETGALRDDVFWVRPNPNLGSRTAIIETDGLPVGGVVLFDIDLYHMSAEIGCYIADEAYLRRGLGALAVREMMKRGFTKLGLERIQAQTDSKNAWINDQMKRSGFVKEGSRRRCALIDGRYHNMIMWSMLRSEFEERWMKHGSSRADHHSRSNNRRSPRAATSAAAAAGGN